MFSNHLSVNDRLSIFFVELHNYTYFWIGEPQVQLCRYILFQMQVKSRKSYLEFSIFIERDSIGFSIHNQLTSFKMYLYLRLNAHLELQRAQAFTKWIIKFICPIKPPTDSEQWLQSYTFGAPGTQHLCAISDSAMTL